MIKTPARIASRLTGLCLLAALAGASQAQASLFVKTNNVDALNLATSWTNNAVPGASDIAQWDSTVSDVNNTTNILGANLSLAGITVFNPAGAITITTNSGGNTLTLGAGGIDLSAASQDLTLSNNVTLADYTVQTWNVPSGRTLSLGSAFTRSGGAALTFNGNGTINIAGGTASSLLAYALINGTDVAALDASKNVSTVSSVIGYTSVSALNVSSLAQYINFDGSSTATGTTADLSMSTKIGYPLVYHFDTPQPSGRGNWIMDAYKGQFELNAGANTILVTTNVGACNVIFEETGSGGITMGWRQSSGSELIIDQEDTAGSIYFQNGLSQKNALAGNMLTKRGAGRAVFNTAMVHTGPTRILKGELMVNSTTVPTSVFTVNSGGTLSGMGNVTGAVTNNGTLWAGTNGLGSLIVGNLTLNAGSALKFYSATVPTTNTAALLNITNGVNVNGAVSVSILSGGSALGQYPLVKSTAAFSGAAFASFALATMPPHVMGYLSNNATAFTIDLVITNIAEPLTWATGSSTWNTNGSSLWLDPQGNATTYQEVSGLGDSVLFEDNLSGSSPITVTLNTALTPSATTVSNSTKSYTFSGTGVIAGSGSLMKSGNGTLTLNTANSFSGGINLNGGTVNFSTLNNLGTGAINFGGGTLKYNGNSDDISVRTVTLGAGGGAINDGGNALTFANPIGNKGPGGLTKLGTGTLTLNGTNVYSGNTVVSSGTLALAYSTYISNSASLFLNSGALLDVYSSGDSPLVLNGSIGQQLAGTGTLVGGVTAGTGSIITPATNGVVGTLTVSNGDLTVSGGTLVFDVSSTARDLIVVTNGNVAISGGTLQLNVTDALLNGSYKLIDYTGGSLTTGAGSSANLTITGVPAGKGVSLSDAVAGEIDLVVSDTASDVITWAGVGSDWDTIGSLNWLKGGTAWAFTNGDAVTFDDTGAAQSGVNLQAAVSPSKVTVTSDTTYYSFYDGTSTGGGKITGAATIVKNGASTLTINTMDDNTGPTVINGGSLQVYGHLGGGSITNYGELVFAETANQDLPGSISGPGNLTQSGSATLSLTANNSFSGGITINSGTLQIGNGGTNGTLGSGATITNNGTLTINRSGAMVLTNAIAGTGNYTQTGGGTVTMMASNNFTGTTTVSNGKLILGQAQALAGQGALVVQAAGTNDLNGYDLTVARLYSSSGAGGRIVNDSGTGTSALIITYNGTGSADSSIIIADNDGTGGKIQLVMNGTSTQMIRSANTYSGGTIINSGALQARSANNAFGSGTNIILNGGMLDNYGSTLAYAVTVTTNSSLYSGANCYFNGPFFGTNNLNVTLAGTVTSGETISWGAAGQLAGFSGKFICNVDATTYGRFWRWANSSGTTNGSATAGWDLEGNVGMTAQNTGYTIYLGSLSGINGTGLSGNSTTYIVGGRNEDTTFSGNVSGSGSIVKTGTGIWTLDGTGNYIATNTANAAYTFSGSTVVSNGTLHLTGGTNPTNSSTIHIASGALLDLSGMGYQVFETNADDTLNDTYTFITDRLDLSTNGNSQTLTGSGTLRGSVVAYTNSTINPGDGIGTLTVTTNVTLGGLLIMELNRTNSPATNDMLVANTITGGGILTVTNLGPNLITGDSFKLFNHPVSGFTVTNLPQTFVQNGATNNYVWLNNLAVDGTIQVTAGASLVNPNPTNIVTSISGSLLTLSWPADHTGWTLQMQTNSLAGGLGTNWVDVAGSTVINSTNITVDPTLPAAFFRLKL